MNDIVGVALAFCFFESLFIVLKALAHMDSGLIGGILAGSFLTWLGISIYVRRKIKEMKK